MAAQCGPTTYQSSLHLYQGLKEPTHIRIMTLKPSLDPESPLHFSFRQASLVEVVGKYEAVSYTWGEPNFTHSLYCEDGARLLITENLHAAIKRLRFPDLERTLWVDAICINQQDVDERSAQVAIMGDIFQKARNDNSTSRALAAFSSDLEVILFRLLH